MRISTAQFQQVSLSSILEQQSKVSRTQEQLATGKRVLVPSDDPTASSLLVEIEQSMDVYKQYNRNADQAETRLRMEETALNSMVNVLQRARELAVQGNNDTYSSQQLIGLASEVRALQDELLGQANVRDSNNEYIFAGYQGNTVPFVKTGGGFGVAANYSYNGDQGHRRLQVGSERYVSDSDSGFELFARIPDPAVPGSYINIFETIDDLAVALETNTLAGAHIEAIDAGMDHLLSYEATVGARLNTIDRQRTTNSDFIYQMELQRSELRDVDFTEAVSRLNQQMTSLQAAQQTFSKVQGLSLFNYL